MHRVLVQAHFPEVVEEGITETRWAAMDFVQILLLVIVLAIVGGIYMLNGLEPIRYGDPSVDNSVAAVPSGDAEGLMQ